MNDDRYNRRIKNLEERLYSRKDRLSELKHDFSFKSPDNDDISQNWSHEEDRINKFNVAPKEKMSMVKKFLIFSILFFVASLAISALVYFGGINVIKADNVEVSVIGQTSVEGGEVLKFQVIIENRNASLLEFANLKITFPDNTRSADDINKELTRSIEEFGQVLSGERVSREISAVLFGQELSKKEINMRLEYRVAGSNAIFEKEKKFEVIISSSPINLRVDSLKEINSNQEINFDLTITSNSSELIENVMILADYAFGFDFIKSDKNPVQSNNLWNIGSLAPGKSKSLSIRGKLSGQDGDEKSFRFSVGVQSKLNPKEIEPIFLTAVESVEIKKPFIGLTLALDGDISPEKGVYAGKDIRSDIEWVNNLNDSINNVEIKVKLEGIALNKNSVRVEKGFYNSAENVVVWDKNSNDELINIDQGQRGKVKFSFSLISPNASNIETYRNSVVNLSASVKGRRVSDIQVPQEISSQEERKVLLMSDLSHSSRLVYNFGQFQNSGPLPPKAEQTTTYTVIWTVANTVNDFRDVEIRAKLPAYVGWLNVRSSQSENISYDENSGFIIWKIDRVKAGAGYTNSAKEVAFQVSFLPSVSQVGSKPIIINEPEITGYDIFANAEFKATGKSINSDLSTDPAAAATSGTVVR